MSAFLEGVIAGYGIAIPVGAIAILIIDTALRGGFRPGFAAGAGAASADLAYAALAALAGGLIAAWLAPYALALKVLSAAVLIGLGGWGLWKLRAARKQEAEAKPTTEIAGAERTYVKFLGLTLLNPATVAYFGALILGGSASTLGAAEGKALFVTGAALASLSWQSLLAALGALAHRHLPPGAQVVTSVIGNLVVIGLGVRMVIQLLVGGT